ncbi:hypothetical protein OG943_44850 [Amycolatopsis sp. NBC_00345]|uniref:hypothetical protein n=1 Tax=Amycolatopsis sp. NBC_00345 TaxID=2975955 RepID=UPI002E26E7D2
MSGDVPVDYGQIYVQSGREFAEVPGSFGGQQNGLCGGAIPGALFLVTGLNSGYVGFSVELHDKPPPLDETWEEIVEVSFRPAGEASLVGWGGSGVWPLDLLETDYRVRYCGTRMDEAHTLGIPEGEERELDRYLLQFWPGPPEPDRVVKQTSATAAYWHRNAREQPPPPSPEEKAAAKRQALQERERVRAEARLKAEEREWGGSLPSERLRQLGNALSVARLDRPLVDALAETDPVTQRAIARWVTRRAFVEAQLTEVEWIAPALAAMDRGEALPSLFDDDRQAWDLLLTDERVPRTTATSPDGRHDNCLQQAMAFPALFSAREPDPLRAAFDALWSAAVTFGYGRHGVLFTEVRQVFPAVAGSVR